jgi:hypothetical protein
MNAPLRDIKGCLTEAGFRAMAAAATAQAPPELAAHLASCSRCQDRMLSGQWAPGALPRPPRRAPPPAWRLWVALIAAALLALMALVTGRHLAGG